MHNTGAHPAFFILTWMFFSSLTILFNKWLIDSAGFRKLQDSISCTFP